MPFESVNAKTDADGRVTLAIATAGAWLVLAVHMVPLSASAVPAEWDSYWVTLAFHTADAFAPEGSRPAGTAAPGATFVANAGA